MSPPEQASELNLYIFYEKAFLKNLIIYIILFLICVLSRMLSSLNYIEDLESLDFTSCILDSEILSCHGSMLFAFLVKVVFVLIPNLPLAFSIIGGLSVFLLIIFVLKLINAPLLSLEGGLTALLIFFNPLIWIMSNRYSPDMLGIALVTGALYLLLSDTGNVRRQSLGWLLIGLLAGVKFYYLIIFIVPSVYSLVNGRKYFSVFFLFLGLSIWILPALFNGRTLADIIGYNIVIQANAFNHAQEILKSIWAGGLGGYWPGRNPFLILCSLGTIVCLFFGILIMLDYGLDRKKLLALILGFIIYLLVLTFSDLSNEFNALLPTVPFFCIIVAYGIIYFIVNFNHFAIKVSLASFLLINMAVTIASVLEHKQLSALAQAKDYLEEHQNVGNKLIIISDPRIASYFSKEIKADYYTMPPTNPPASVLISIGKPVAGRKVKNHITFHHDPFINKYLPAVDLYEY